VLISTLALLLVTLTGMTIFSQSPIPRVKRRSWPQVRISIQPEYVVLERGDLDDDELANGSGYRNRVRRGGRRWTVELEANGRLGWRS